MNANKPVISLDNLDVTVVVDRSGSMGEPLKNGMTRWKYSEETILHFVEEIGKHDDDGIDLCFFNRAYQTAEGVKPESFRQVWNRQGPGGGTNMAAPLSWALQKAVARLGEKNQFIILLTDGQPDDKADVARVIVEATKHMSRDEQIGILILQVGEDPQATQFLEKLDTDLAREGAKFDIVHREPIDAIAGMPLQDVVNLTFNE